jgi:nucleoside-diphosphate-sugar epimerase
MAEVIVTGLGGFVGSYLKTCYANNADFDILPFTLKGISQIEIPDGVSGVIHLAGKAHDLKGKSNWDEYFYVNTTLTEQLFDAFLKSQAEVFIFVSSVKAAADHVDEVLNESYIANPETDYGKSKLLAEQYILAKSQGISKRVYILRPCMIHGPGNKGNLNLLYRFAKNKLPWPLGAFHNKRSFCSIDNLVFVIDQLLKRKDIPSGIYNVADDDAISTAQLVKIIGKSLGNEPHVLQLPKKLIYFIASIGDLIGCPLTTHALNKLTENFVVSNLKIKSAIGKELPFSMESGFQKTFESFKNTK